ncbi:hypothetical protein IOK49_04920 [Fervidicoccus fontis]|uniref:Uncharacterized protein n=2 Tax=Fervidicoccus fontis TaxID=683846 RepID=I0A226_FERFK|nr:hypothetical protein [Fervidicoccus fontis]AFH43033.1 hypothetical protein FFONT_1045 [Fervidicoccus fontis Kam940]MBE9391413.1 hypothetical protein [Fervidicoccus fontis]
MRWPKKREFLTFYALYKNFGKKEVSFHEMISYVHDNLGYNIKTSKHIIKRLINFGMISIVGKTYVVKDLDEYLGELYRKYYEKRRSTKKL